jgi:hypothetical protein
VCACRTPAPQFSCHNGRHTVAAASGPSTKTRSPAHMLSCRPSLHCQRLVRPGKHVPIGQLKKSTGPHAYHPQPRPIETVCVQLGSQAQLCGIEPTLVPGLAAIVVCAGPEATQNILFNYHISRQSPDQATSFIHHTFTTAL